MNDQSQAPSGGSLWLTVIAVVGLFLLFGIILFKTYLPAREPDTAKTPVFSAADMAELDKLAPAEREAKLAEMRWDRRVPTPDDRKARLTDLREKESAALTAYTWADKEKGVVRLPITQAMELTVQELRRAKGAR